MEQNVFHNQPSDEIDLRELAQTLWASKLLIILATLFFTCVAAAYAFFSTPIYETQVQTLPPTANDLSSYNIGSQLTGAAISGITQANSFAAVPSSIKELSVKDAYDIFLQRLTSDTVRKQFFDSIYLPAHSSHTSQTSKEQLWNRLKRQLTVALPNKDNDNEATVTVSGTDPKAIASWANAYVKLAISAAQKELIGNFSGEVALRSKSVDDQISTLRNVARITRQDRITRLKDALRVADSIGLEIPSNSGNLITSYTGETMYLRGAKALRAEINVLEQRKNDDPYIEGLPDLLKKQSLLKGIDLNPAHLAVATIDRVATAPESPIKPKKGLILALGVILGGMLGISIILIRALFKRPR